MLCQLFKITPRAHCNLFIPPFQQQLIFKGNHPFASLQIHFPGLQSPEKVQVLVIVFKALVPLAIFDQSQKDFKGFPKDFSQRRLLNTPSLFTGSRKGKHSQSQPTPTTTIYHGKEGGFPEDVKVRNQIFPACRVNNLLLIKKVCCNV